jgi:hypothetical protein
VLGRAAPARRARNYRGGQAKADGGQQQRAAAGSCARSSPREGACEMRRHCG